MSAELLVVSGPTCVGKTLLLERLLAARPELVKPVTTTTRAPRAGEQHGVDYYFLTRDEFEAGIAAGDFVEYANVHGNYYGLSKQGLADARRDGKIPAVILDVQGKATVEKLLPIVSVFIAAPLEEIRGRLLASRPAAEVEARLASVPLENAASLQYDCVVANPDGLLDTAFVHLLAFYLSVSDRFQ